ncbi:oxidoreductase [Mesobacillus maritimus]|uniref:Oxidoreductase n=1 Tax=Mesobacillus maritimus TaxID=1643336 RepID=A0ABS7K4V7_9BACI|nr:oxidoreductase [Mesobacillus maritimus]MBY0097155.1 oxidoreductase [Mesobacillus maritimus]
MMEKATKSALIVGATGLVGKELVDIVLNEPNYHSVTILTRKLLPLTHPKLEQIITDFDQLDQYQQHLQVDDVYCCLGTTIKTAGSQDAFRKVDLTYPLELAVLTKSLGAQKFLIITAMGADPDSKVFYSRVKGEIEVELKDLGFSALHIFRPSLLLGERQEFRLGERIGVILSPVLSFLMVGSLKKYKPIHAKVVAMAMYQASLLPKSGSFTYESDEIYRLSTESNS